MGQNDDTENNLNHTCATCFKKYECKPCHGIKSVTPCIFMHNDSTYVRNEVIRNQKLYFCSITCFHALPALMEGVGVYLTTMTEVFNKIASIAKTCEDEHDFERKVSEYLDMIEDDVDKFMNSVLGEDADQSNETQAE